MRSTETHAFEPGEKAGGPVGAVRGARQVSINALRRCHIVTELYHPAPVKLEEGRKRDSCNANDKHADNEQISYRVQEVYIGSLESVNTYRRFGLTSRTSDSRPTHTRIFRKAIEPNLYGLLYPFTNELREVHVHLEAA